MNNPRTIFELSFFKDRDIQAESAEVMPTDHRIRSIPKSTSAHAEGLLLQSLQAQRAKQTDRNRGKAYVPQQFGIAVDPGARKCTSCSTKVWLLV